MLKSDGERVSLSEEMGCMSRVTRCTWAISTNDWPLLQPLSNTSSKVAFLSSVRTERSWNATNNKCGAGLKSRVDNLATCVTSHTSHASELSPWPPKESNPFALGFERWRNRKQVSWASFFFFWVLVSQQRTKAVSWHTRTFSFLWSQDKNRTPSFFFFFFQTNDTNKQGFLSNLMFNCAWMFSGGSLHVQKNKKNPSQQQGSDPVSLRCAAYQIRRYIWH